MLYVKPLSRNALQTYDNLAVIKRYAADIVHVVRTAFS